MNKEEILAMEAGIELDHLVMKEIYNASLKYYGEDEIWYHYDSNGEPDYEWSCYNSPSTDISAAWEVVGKLCSDDNYKWSFGMEYSTVIDWVVDFTPRKNHEKAREYPAFQAQSLKAPEAICKAALLAVMEENT